MRELVLFALSVAACDAIPVGDGSRKAVLRAIGDEVIVPSYAEVAVRADELASAAAAVLPALDAAALEELQRRWRAVRGAWMATQAHRIGPVRDDYYEGKLAQWPVDPEEVEGFIAGDAILDTAFVSGQGGNKKGLGIAEYLLFAGAGGEGDPLAALADPRRQAYLAATLDVLARDAAALSAAWLDGYLERYIDVGAADAPFANIKDAIDAVINAQVFLAENVADVRLGKPLGSMTGGTPQPSLVESRWSDNGAADMLAAYDGLALIFDGEGPRLGDLVADARPSVAARVRDELAAARAAVEAIPHPLTAAVEQEAPETQLAWEAARALKTTYQAEVIAALGATLSLNDNDGD